MLINSTLHSTVKFLAKAAAAHSGGPGADGTYASNCTPKKLKMLRIFQIYSIQNRLASL